MCLQKRFQKCWLEFSLLHCGSPYWLYWNTCMLDMFTKGTPPPPFSICIMTTVPNSECFPYVAWDHLFLGEVTCKSRMDNWRKEEELLEWCNLTSRFRDLLLCGAQGDVHGCHRVPVQNAKFFPCTVYGVAAEVRWQLLWCIFALPCLLFVFFFFPLGKKQW